MKVFLTIFKYTAIVVATVMAYALIMGTFNDAMNIAFFGNLLVIITVVVCTGIILDQLKKHK